MGHFYETTFFDRFDLRQGDEQSSEQGFLGWQILASPPEVDGLPVPYDEFVRELGSSEPVERFGLTVALQIVGDPASPWNTPTDIGDAGPTDKAHSAWGWMPRHARSMQEHVDGLLDQPLFAAEASPVRPRSLAELAALATTSIVTSIGDLPAVVLVGAAIGLVVIRPLAAVGGALWEGARGEIVELGEDTATILLGALRHRLGIPPDASSTVKSL